MREPDTNPDSEPDPESVGRAIALRKLAASPQTRAQLADAMAAKGVPEDVRERILGRFSDVGLIDDIAFSRAWVDSRHHGRGLGKKALAHELRRRGVDAATAGEAVAAVTPESEEAMARELVAKRLLSLSRLDAAAKTRRLAGMLARKGYAAGLAYRVIREALDDDSASFAEYLEGDDLEL